MNESHSSIGKGYKWLRHILKSNDEDNQLLSQRGKVVLEHMLGVNKVNERLLLDLETKVFDDNFDNGDKSWDFVNRSNQSFKPMLFPILLDIVNKLSEKRRDSNTLSSTTTVPTTKEILETFIQYIEEPDNEKKINVEGKDNDNNETPQESASKLKQWLSKLPPSSIPCSLNSNQLIFSALLFLSEDLHIAIQPSQSIPTHHSIDGYDPISCFPKMPLLTKHVISKGGKTIPYGFEKNTRNENLNNLKEERFLDKLSLLESCFWSNISKVKHIKRLHVLPRTGTGLTISKADLDILMVSGTIQDTPFDITKNTSLKRGRKGTSGDLKRKVAKLEVEQIPQRKKIAKPVTVNEKVEQKDNTDPIPKMEDQIDPSCMS